MNIFKAKNVATKIEKWSILAIITNIVLRLDTIALATWLRAFFQKRTMSWNKERVFYEY